MNIRPEDGSWAVYAATASTIEELQSDFTWTDVSSPTPLKPTMVGITPTGEFIWELRPAPECDAKYFDRKERTK